ncbi:MAG TPA: hypothetical protein VIG34_09100 [Xanthobacteraceae bacterium]
MAEPANSVTVVDFRVPFWRLVAFLLKLALAAIPAAILFAIIIGVIVAVLRAVGFGVMMWQWQI